mgnify:CR=1 FL=1|jgi:phosphonate transport system substrate-binding protein
MARSPRRRFLRTLLGLTFGLGLTRIAGAAPAGVFVIHPYDTPSRLYARFRPLTLYLGGVLGRPLRLVIASSYDEQIEMIASGRADYAYLGPTPYVRARRRGVVQILAGEAESGQAFYQSALVVRTDSPLRRVADLAGKRIALGDAISMSSALAPKQILAQAGLRRADLAEVAHLDRHERVALAVLHGDYDAGGLRLDIAKTYLPRGLRILATSQPLPPHAVVASPQISKPECEHVRLALLYPDEDGARAMRSLGEKTSFVAVEDSHYQAVRRMQDALESW